MRKNDVKQMIRIAYHNPELRKPVLGLLREAGFIDDWGDRTVTNPDTGNKVKVKSLRPDKSQNQKRLLQKLQDQYTKTKRKTLKDPRLHTQNTNIELQKRRRVDRNAVVTKYELEEEDLEDLRAKAPMPNPTADYARDAAKVMQEFLRNAKPETRERMKGMTPQEFKVLWFSIMDNDEQEAL